MTANSLVPPESNTAPPQSKLQAGLMGPHESMDYGRQLSSFTELQQGKKTGNLFALSESPLKTE